jgi:ABC-type transporter Mla subunit MlaD
MMNAKSNGNVYFRLIETITANQGKLIDAVTATQAKMLETLTEQGKTIATLTQQMSDMSERLFSPQGALNRLVESLKASEIDAAKGITNAMDETKRVDVELQRIDRRVAYFSGVAAVVGALLGVVGKYLVSALLR